MKNLNWKKASNYNEIYVIKSLKLAFIIVKTLAGFDYKF